MPPLNPYRQRLEGRFRAIVAELLPGRDLTPKQAENLRRVFDAGATAALSAMVAKLEERERELGQLINPIDPNRMTGSTADFISSHVTGCRHLADRLRHPEQRGRTP